jgi:membrane protein required for colicin V production
MPIQWLDVILLLVMLISAFLAMRRGLIAEMLSLVAWAVAALIALFIYSLYRERVRALIGSQLVADLLLIGVVFLVVLLILGVVIPYLFPAAPTGGPAGAVDRTLGFVFGLIRGLILVVIVYELVAVTTPKDALPRWVTEARSLPLIERTGRALLSLLPDNPASIFRSSGRDDRLAPYVRQAATGTRAPRVHGFPRGRRVTISAAAG